MDSATPGESMGTKSNGEQNRESASGDLTRWEIETRPAYPLSLKIFPRWESRRGGRDRSNGGGDDRVVVVESSGSEPRPLWEQPSPRLGLWFLFFQRFFHWNWKKSDGKTDRKWNRIKVSNEPQLSETSGLTWVGSENVLRTLAVPALHSATANMQ